MKTKWFRILSVVLALVVIGGSALSCAEPGEEVAELEAQIAELESEIAELESDIADLESDIAALTEPPEAIVVDVATPSDVGSIAYGSIVSVAESVRRVVPIDIAAASIPGDIAVLSALKDGTADFIMPGSATVQTAFRGLGVFEEAGWEPMPDIRALWTIRWTDVGIGVKADSDIYSLYDLKGKRFAICEVSDAYMLGARALAAWIEADLETDFEHVVAPDYSGAILYVKDGFADFAMSGMSAANAYETEAAPGGLRWLTMSPDDTAGWQRWKDSWPVPGYGPVFRSYGTAAAIPEEGVWGFGSPYAWVCLKDMDEEVVYTLAKGLSMGYQYFWDLGPHLWQSSLANNTDTGFTLVDIPLHAGVVRWFKEIGCWTPDLEAEQAKRLEAIGAAE